MTPMGITSAQGDQEAMGRAVSTLIEQGEEELAEVMGFCSLDWWTEPNDELGVSLGSDYAIWYPLHFAMLLVPTGLYDLIVDNYADLHAAVGDALETSDWEPLEGFTIQEVADPAPPMPTTDDGTPLLNRDGHSLTPIEAAFYDELRETDLVFSVQTTLHSAGERRRPDFLVYTNGAPMVVELDGHAHHHTRKQRTENAQRERWLSARGFHFIRFTGSEVTADAQRCVRELRDLIARRGR